MTYEKEKRFIIIVLFLSLFWFTISAYWYTCVIKDFCQNDNTGKIVEVQDDAKDDNEGYEEYNEYENESDGEVIEINENSIKNKNDNVKKVVTRNFIIKEFGTNIKDKEGKKVIKCETYLNTKISLKNKNFSGDVEKLEKFLNEIYKAELFVDGIYDEIDADYVKQFQYDNNLESDGVIGKKTLNYINALYCVNQYKKEKAEKEKAENINNNN